MTLQDHGRTGLESRRGGAVDAQIAAGVAPGLQAVLLRHRGDRIGQRLFMAGGMGNRTDFRKNFPDRPRFQRTDIFHDSPSPHSIVSASFWKYSAFFARDNRNDRGVNMGSILVCM